MTDGHLKAPRKPWYRPRNVLLALLLVILALAGYIGFETWRHSRAVANPDHDYREDFHEIARRVAGIDEAAWDAEANRAAWNEYLNVLTVIAAEVNQFGANYRPTPEIEQRERGGWYGIDFSYVLRGERIPENIDPERGAIEHVQELGLLDNLDRVLSHGLILDTRPLGDPLYYTLPELSQTRMTATMLAAMMRVAADRGDFAHVAQQFEKGLMLARILRHQSTLISGLVGVAVESLMLSELRNELLEYELDEAHCRALLDVFDPLPQPPAWLALEAERHYFHQSSQWYFSDDGSGEGYLLADSTQALQGFGLGGGSSANLGSFADAFYGRFIHASRRETLAKYDEMMDRTLEELRKPPNERWTDWHPDEDGFESLSFRYGLVGILMPAIVKSIDSFDVYTMQREGTRLMIAIECFRAIHDKYPSSLAELVPDSLPALPTDAINGKPYGYRLLEEPDEYGRPYLLYSYGRDGEDHDGTVVESQEWAAIDKRYLDGYEEFFLSQGIEGVDFIINQPRREEY